MLAMAVSLLAACNADTGSAAVDDEGDEGEVGMVDVTLTDAQASQLEIATGPLEQFTFADGIEVKGLVEVSPQSVAEVTPYIGANVKSVLVHEGDKVSKGQVLATLSHPDLLDMQSRLLTAVNRLTYVNQELDRQKRLVAGNAGAGKNLQQTQSEQNTLRAEISTLSSQLNLLGINPEEVKKGNTATQISVKSPISGTVEQVNTAMGQFADPQNAMFRIVNTDNLFADLRVYEKDIKLVKEGQTVMLSPQSDPSRTMMAKIYSVGKTLDPESKAVHVRANFTGSLSGLVSGMYLSGKIASSQQKCLAIGEDGVVEDAGKYYIFSAAKNAGKWLYHPIQVVKGREENGQVEIVITGEKPATVAQTGAYYILSEMKKSETGEED